jgi:hypothetical protein
MDAAADEMPPLERSLPLMTPRRDSGDSVRDLLDVLPVVDNVYHHLAFTRPLVDALVAEVRRIAPAGRVLVVGPNELLAQVLVKLGYEVDLWVVDGLPLSDQALNHASRRGGLEQILGSPADQPADMVVVPYVAEAASIELPELLKLLRVHMRASGSLIVACRQPGELQHRLHRILRTLHAVGPQESVLPPSPTWPNLPARRRLTGHDFAIAGGGLFQVARTELILDHRACMTSEALSLWKWLAKEGLHAAKVAVPAFRDCALVTLVTSTSRPSGPRRSA